MDVPFDVEETRYVTVLENEEGMRMYRSGRFVGNRVIGKGHRPFPDREIVYEVVDQVTLDSIQDGDDAVFAVATDDS